MSNETLEELKAIIANAPEGATIVDIENDGFIDYLYCDTNAPFGEKIKSCSNSGDSAIEYSNGNIRSLSDIERIIELMEIVEDAAALGFLTPSFDSGISHKQLCKKYEALK